MIQKPKSSSKKICNQPGCKELASFRCVCFKNCSINYLCVHHALEFIVDNDPEDLCEAMDKDLDDIGF